MAVLCTTLVGLLVLAASSLSPVKAQTCPASVTTMCSADDQCNYALEIPTLKMTLPVNPNVKAAERDLEILEKTFEQLRLSVLRRNINQEVLNRLNEVENNLKTVRRSLDGARDRNVEVLHAGQHVKQDRDTHRGLKTLEESMDQKFTGLKGMLEKLLKTCARECSSDNPVSRGPPKDCADVYKTGLRENGVYSITPNINQDSVDVYCDMKSGGGGWTVIQRRMDGSVNFTRKWVDYQRGFGNLTGEFWIGLDSLHEITRRQDYVLRVELEDWDKVSKFARYGAFYVADARDKYRLHIDGYSGTAGDAFRFSDQYMHDNQQFTTYDEDHDKYPSGNCGWYYKAGWWFDACLATNLNGVYYQGMYTGIRDGIFWGTWHNLTLGDLRFSFKYVDMKIRPVTF
ncbi:fibroleukin-like [Branchiostoma floridae]|uniref:Fibroleukin-like n=1 Tax=Branchiostoma floridae TaxID=7739 RepID=A0A9J7L5Y5_BRAFL|nr:fibroleukin-like [Branchiostoma floridae]